MLPVVTPLLEGMKATQTDWDLCGEAKMEEDVEACSCKNDLSGSGCSTSTSSGMNSGCSCASNDESESETAAFGVLLEEEKIPQKEYVI